jgi:hypothetical protein
MISIKDMTPSDYSVIGKYAKYYKILEYIVVTIVVFILAIVFWNLFAFLLEDMNKC